MTFSVQRRNPNEIMKLNRLGCFHQSKLSFLRSFIREFKDWSFKNEIFELDEDGYGTAVYSVSNNQRTYSLICYANKLDDSERSDRVIATKWDATFVLFDGIPSKTDIDRLRNNVPIQEAGRVSEKEITLSRANKSKKWIFGIHVQGDPSNITSWPLEDWHDFLMWPNKEAVSYTHLTLPTKA